MILPMPALPQSGNHFIVCGDGQLAFRITEELTSRYREQVTVILPSRRKGFGARISALPGVDVLERSELTDQAFTDAGVASARAVALLWREDIVNFHAALRAQDLNPAIRLVLAVFNTRLAEHFRVFFTDCTMLSGTEMAAPAFVAAALGEPAPSHVEVFGRTLYVARRDEVPADHVVCGIVAVPGDPAGATRLLPPGMRYIEPTADPNMTRPDRPSTPHNERLVLAVANGERRDPLARRRHPLRTVAAAARRVAWNKYGLVFAVLLAVILAGLSLILSAYFAKDHATYSVSNAVYLALMDLTGSALTSVSLSGPEKLSQVLLTVDGMAFLPVVTALIVGARVTGSLRGEPKPPGGHVIVAGLGNVGTKVVTELHALGFRVVCVDPDPAAHGITAARRLGLPVVIGDAFAEDILRTAGIDTATALVAVTSNDIVNLETALQAHALRDDLRIVLRLFDDDLARRVQQTVGNIVSRSVSYLAASAFAVAMLEHSVLCTIAVGRHVLLIADVRVADGADLVGKRLVDMEDDGLARILALQARGTHRPDWQPQRDYELATGDRVIVVATRAGLSRFLSGNRSSLSSSAPVTEFRSGLAREMLWRYAERVNRARTTAAQTVPGDSPLTREGPHRPGWEARRHHMSVNEDSTVQPAVQPAVVPSPGIADPAPLGLAAFALTTFLLSASNAGWMTAATGSAWLGYAFAYGGFGQLLAGMWEFRNRNVFGATAFSTYGGFWIGLGLWALLVAPAKANTAAMLGHDLGWILLAFAIFNTYMLIMSTQINTAVFAVFLTLEITEIVLFIGNFAGNTSIVKVGGVIGVITAVAAWYTSCAGVSNGIGGRIKLPVGKPLIS
jgi:succinate-acetate transporter protein/Trk K+ transport system NAD-binding subunit